MAKYHASIKTLPIFNWNEIFETGNLSFLFIDPPGTFSISKAEVKSLFKRSLLAKRWRDLIDQHVQEFGFSDEFLEIIELRTKIARLRLRRIQSQDRGVQLLIDIESDNLKRMIEARQKSGPPFGEVVMSVRKYMGQDINTRTTSVYDFSHAVRMLKKDTQTKSANGRK